MAKCGVKKYDNLPARVGWWDVDAMRFAYGETLKRKRSLEAKLDKAIRTQAKKHSKGGTRK